MPENILGMKLKKLRKEKNITQDKLSEKLGLSGRYVGKIEAGMIKPSSWLTSFKCRLNI